MYVSWYDDYGDDHWYNLCLMLLVFNINKMKKMLYYSDKL